MTTQVRGFAWSGLGRLAGWASLACAVALLGPACNKPQKLVLTKEQQRTIDESILKEAPKPGVPIGANLGDKVKLIGVDMPESITPGKPATIVWYWELLGEVSDDWMVFVHLERPGQKRQILDHHPVDGLYPMGQWKKGQIVKDVQKFTVDSGFTNGEAVLWVGIFNKVAWETKQANDRLKLVNAKDVKNDGDDRIEAARTVVTGGASAAEAATQGRPPTYVVKRADGAITIDGKLDEAAWAGAPRTRTFLRPDGRPLGPELATFARMLYDDTNLYVAFDVTDSDIASDKAGRDDKIWEQDAVEVYLDPGSDGKRYLEIQVSPRNMVFDAMFDSSRTPPWEEAAKRTTLALQTAVSVDGTVNDPGPDKGWTVELAIPFADIPDSGGKAPAPGTSWTANLYRIDHKGPTNMAFQGVWAPVGGDFHKLDGAGVITFAPAMPKVEVPPKPDEPAPAPVEGEPAKPEAPAQPSGEPAKPEGHPTGEPAKPEGQPTGEPAKPEEGPAPTPAP